MVGQMFGGILPPLFLQCSDFHYVLGSRKHGNAWTINGWGKREELKNLDQEVSWGQII